MQGRARWWIGFFLPFLFTIWKSGVVRAQTTEEFCQQAQDLAHFQNLISDDQGRLGFTNHGGIFESGTCWWHSRFQRAMTYLALFRPDLPKPSRAEITNIIWELSRMRSMVLIPGYSNIRQFSWDWQVEIQQLLDSWQMYDGFIKQSWIEGLAGQTTVSSNKLKQIMDDLYNQVVPLKRIVYQKLQVVGIEAHSWLVVAMEKTQKGYNLNVVDSNSLKIKRHNYKYGDRYFTKDYDQYVPYTKQQKEFQRIQSVILRFCKPELAFEKWMMALEQKLTETQDEEKRRKLWALIEQARIDRQFRDDYLELTLKPSELHPENWKQLFQP